MALTDKLTAIANAIRAKSGKSNALTLDEMPTEIGALSAEEQLKASGYPSYVSPAVLDVAEKVRSVQKSDSITFIAMSDSHYPAEQPNTWYGTENIASSVQANQAMKAMAYLLDVDFVAHLGDVCCGASTTTPDMLKSQIEGFLSYFREAKSDLPVFLAVGNHDTGYYSAEAGQNMMTGEYLYNTFTSQSASDNTVFGDPTYGGYCYRDFADKKLRVFLLNSSEGMTIWKNEVTKIPAVQKLWFANALLDLNSKSNAADWNFVVLCHFPFDYVAGDNSPLNKIAKAYIKGESITISGSSDENFTSTTVNFSGKNSAKFIAQFHGHVHNFITSRLHDENGAQYDVWRMCIPNIQYERENYYGVYNGVNFKEDITYSKKANTADGTSFVVNVINPSEKKIYSFCYGAGYDRVIGYAGIVYRSITYNLSNVELDSTVYSVEDGKPLSLRVKDDSIPENYNITSTQITMGGVDITSTAYSGGVITIAEVTGNVVITIKATKIPTTNLGLFAESADSTAIYNGGLGYRNNYRLGGSGETVAPGYVITGYMPYTVTYGVLPETIEIQGVELDDTDAYCKAYFYSTKTNDGTGAITPYIEGGTNTNTKRFAEVYTIETLGYKHYKLTPIKAANGSWIGTNGSSIKYFRLSMKGSGEDFIVNIGEEKIISYTVLHNFTNVISSNKATLVAHGSTYTTTLSGEITSITVTMGGVDITSTAYANGVITIAEVTGDIVITAVASAPVTSYTNQLPISTDTDGTVYNGKGYKENSYISSSGGGISSRTGYYATGFIPAKYGDIIRLANVTAPSGDNYCRFNFYTSDKVHVANLSLSATGWGSQVYDANGNLSRITISGSSFLNDTIAYIRFCCAGMDDTSIITVNEPIE